MNNFKQLSISHFPSGRFVITGNGGLITSNSCQQVKDRFKEKNDLSEKALRALGKNYKIWPDWVPVAHVDAGGETLFNDRGNLITFDRVDVTDDEIRLALEHAHQKFGNPIHLSGKDLAFTKRMACIATDLGLAISNPEMQETIKNHLGKKMKTLGCPVCGAQMDLCTYPKAQYFMCSKSPICTGVRQLTDSDASNHFFDIFDAFHAKYIDLKFAIKNQVKSGVVLDTCGFMAILSVGRGVKVVHNFEIDGIAPPPVGSSLESVERLLNAKKGVSK